MSEKGHYNVDDIIFINLTEIINQAADDDEEDRLITKVAPSYITSKVTFILIVSSLSFVL